MKKHPFSDPICVRLDRPHWRHWANVLPKTGKYADLRAAIVAAGQATGDAESFNVTFEERTFHDAANEYLPPISKDGTPSENPTASAFWRALIVAGDRKVAATRKEQPKRGISPEVREWFDAQQREADELERLDAERRDVQPGPLPTGSLF